MTVPFDSMFSMLNLAGLSQEEALMVWHLVPVVFPCWHCTLVVWESQRWPHCCSYSKYYHSGDFMWQLHHCSRFLYVFPRGLQHLLKYRWRKSCFHSSCILYPYGINTVWILMACTIRSGTLSGSWGDWRILSENRQQQAHGGHPGPIPWNHSVLPDLWAGDEKNNLKDLWGASGTFTQCLDK